MLKDVEQLGRRAEPLLAVFLEEGVHHLLEERGELRVQLAQTPWPVGEHPLEHHPDLRIREGMLGRRQFVEEHSQSMEVRAAVDLFAARIELLRRRVKDRPHKEPRLRKAESLGLDQRHPEVHDLHHLVAGDEHVLGLQVPVHRTCGVDGGETLRHLAGDVAAENLGDAAELSEERAQGLPLHVLHDEIVEVLALRACTPAS